MKYNTIRFIGLLLIGFGMQSCRTLSVENDVVYSLKRVKAEFTYNFALEKYSKFISLNQTIIKEIRIDSTDVYTAYDLIKLESNSFNLDKKVFIIVDNKPFPIEVKSIDSDVVSNIEEQRKDVLTSDSTTISVVTGYEENEVRNFRISYPIDNAIIEKISTSDNVMLRYYAGPDQITIKIKGYDLVNLKKMMAMN